MKPLGFPSNEQIAKWIGNLPFCLGDIFQRSQSQHWFIFICGPDADVLIAGAPGAPMDVKCHDANRDYVIVTWKPPNTTSESPVIGYFVDKYVIIGMYLILFIDKNMYILKNHAPPPKWLYPWIHGFFIFIDPWHWNSVAYSVKLLCCFLANF